MNLIELKYQYVNTLRDTKKLKEKACDKRDKKIFGEIERHTQFVIDWLTLGYEPGNPRGIEKLAGYQRCIATDPLIIDSLEVMLIEEEENDAKIEWIESMLLILTEREREALLMLANGHSYGSVADIMGCQRGAVQTFFNRARKKIRDKYPNACITKATI